MSFVIVRKLTLLIIISITMYACNNNKKGVFKRTYYKTGKLKSYGYYVNDTIPIDTLITLYENGKTKSIELYNSFGKLDGINKTYYINGQPYQSIPYSNGVINGFVYEYKNNGSLSSKEYYHQNKAIGDLYVFDKNFINYYAFFDFKENKINHIEYDTLGKIEKNNRQVIFIDSIKVYQNKAKKQNFYNLLLLISNPPKTYNNVAIQSFSINGNAIEKDTINGHDCYIYKTEVLSDTLAQIVISITQFDSILNKPIYQKSIKNFQH